MQRIQRFGSIIILFLVLSISITVQTQQLTGNEDKKLLEEILSVYKSEGEQGLRKFANLKKKQISDRFIIALSIDGLKERKEEWLKICEILAEERKDELLIAKIQLQMGCYFYYISEDQLATQCLDKSLPIFKKANSYAEQGSVFNLKGLICSNENNYEKSREFLNKAMEVYLKAGNLKEQGRVYLSMGTNYFNEDNFPMAFEMYEKALPILEKFSDNEFLGEAYNRKGTIYFYIGNNSTALEMYNKGLNAAEQAKDIWTKGVLFMKLGMVYNITGDIKKSLEMYDNALDIFEKVNDPSGKASVYQFKGEIFFFSGNISKAIELYNKALHIIEKINSALGLGNIYKLKGEVYLFIGNLSKSNELFDKALTFYEKARLKNGQGNVYIRKGQIFMMEGKNEEALNYFNKALNFFFEPVDFLGQGNAFFNMGDCYFNSGDSHKALEMYEKALSHYLIVNSELGIGNTYHSKGVVLFKLKDYSKALDMYEKAIVYYEKITENEALCNVLYRKGMALEKLGKKKEALAFFEAGISKLEKIRIQIPLIRMRQSLVDRLYDNYDKTIDFLLRNNDYNRAFKNIEFMRARGFLDVLSDGLVEIKEGVSPALKKKLTDLETLLSQLAKEIGIKTLSGDDNDSKELKKKYETIELDYDDVLIKIRLENPLYASVQYPEPAEPQTIQKEILKNNETLLEYFISNENSYVFVLNKETLKVVPLNIKGELLNGDIQEYLNALSENDENRILRLGKILYRKLFKPIEPLLKKYQEIIIVPDGILSTIPFESFIIDNNKIESGRPLYLIDKYRIKYIQSASVLSLVRKFYQRDSKTDNFAGFGDPVYDYENFKQGKPEEGSLAESSRRGDEIAEIHHSRYGRDGGTWKQLTHTGEEITAIASIFNEKSQKTQVFLRDQASETNAKSAQLKDFDYIHFSCHGLLHDDFQSLVLSQLPTDLSTDDGYFTLNEVMNCEYNAKLIVLSACQTGSGKMELGEGITGLTRAFMHAGSPAVVASLWDVDDKATKELMIHFYRNILEKKMDKVEALRQAKLELIKNKDFSIPSLWSAFVMYGE